MLKRRLLKVFLALSVVLVLATAVVAVSYTDIGAYADVECSILFQRELKEEEIEDVLNAASTILSGKGNVTIYAVQEVACRGFSLVEEEDSEQ